MALVYHHKNPRESFCYGLDKATDERIESDVKGRGEPNNYEFVCWVDSNNPNEVYALTNHISGDWAHNEKVSARPGIKRRSTSIGDLIVIGDKEYIVARVGFKEVK